MIFHSTEVRNLQAPWKGVKRAWKEPRVILYPYNIWLIGDWSRAVIFDCNLKGLWKQECAVRETEREISTSCEEQPVIRLKPFTSSNEKWAAVAPFYHPHFLHRRYSKLFSRTVNTYIWDSTTSSTVLGPMQKHTFSMVLKTRRNERWRNNSTNIRPGLIFSPFLRVTKLTHYELQRHR